MVGPSFLQLKFDYVFSHIVRNLGLDFAGDLFLVASRVCLLLLRGCKPRRESQELSWAQKVHLLSDHLSEVRY